MIYCKNCGKKIELGANFCSKCGTKMIIEDSQVQQTPKVKDIRDNTSIKSKKLRFVLVALVALVIAYFVYVEVIKTKCEDALFYTPAVGAVTGGGGVYGGNYPAREGFYSARGGQYKEANDAIRGCMASQKFNF